ncbi:MAG: bifunctional diguanylate cyclase/phosphodiesterase [Coriobacteriia bacterium]|nr:bifunctional diguanylate cyclase/phosphodiesterase [Coriobacteriia bacterium]
MADNDSNMYDALLESWLEFAKAIDEHPEIRALLFDPVTGLPTTPLLFPRISSLLEERGEVSLLAVNVVRYSKIEEIYGWKVFDDVMREVAEVLDGITGTVLRDSDMLAELMISGNAFVVVLSPPRNTVRMEPEARQLVVQKVESSIREKLADRIDSALFKKFGCYVGASTVTYDETVRLERLVYEGLDAALADSNQRESVDAEERRRRLREILKNEAISTLVHPVFDLADMRVIGYEALSRGPEGSEFERPDKLFAVAYDTDLVLRLERLCRKKALEAATGLSADKLLFLNIEPDAVCDPELREALTTSLLAQARIGADRVVLEITERAAITDFTAFRSTLEYVRALGFKVAIDDAGAGYGSLQCLAEVHPDWLKIDMSLVRSCDTDDVRAQLVSSLVRFADKVGVGLIAEGIETREELHTLRDLGVKYGQGFLFTLPVVPFPDEADYASFKEL